MSGLVRIPVRAVEDYIDPFDCPPWGCDPFTREDVAIAVTEGRLRADPVDPCCPWSVHVERIAWFVVHGWDPEVDSIEFDVGVPGGWGHDWWPVLDGNHRVCAAMVRGDEWLDCYLAGSFDACADLFGVYPDGTVPALV